MSTTNSMKYSDSKHYQKEPSISDILRALLKKKDITEADLARLTKLPQATINRILLGGTSDPRVSTLKALSQCFGLTLDQLVGIEPLDVRASEPSTDKEPESVGMTIPIIRWDQIMLWVLNKGLPGSDTSESWINTERKISSTSYALHSLPFMGPRFKTNSIIIVDPELRFYDGHFVIVAFDGINPTVRRIMFDGARVLLKPIEKSLSIVELQPHHRIFGTIVETRLDFCKR